SVTALRSVSVTVNARLTITATAGPNPTDDGVRVGLAPVSAGGVDAVTCSWDFGDAAGATGCSTGHAYTSTGTFTATVTATDVVGVTTAASVTIIVNPLPGVDFNFGPAKPMAGEPVNFTAATTGGSGPFSFNWNYGDGGSGSGNPASHSFAAAGTFSVTISAADSANHAARATRTIVVNSRLTVTTAASPNPADAGVPVSFATTSTGGVGSLVCNWSFGDSWSASKCDTIHTYATTGSFTARLTATDTLGVTSPASLPIGVTVAP